MNTKNPVAKLHKTLTRRPESIHSEQIIVREFTSELDIECWLRIRNSTASELAKGRSWNEADFRREFQSLLRERAAKTQQTSAIWFAEPDSNCDPVAAKSTPIGTISCRANDSRSAATINWLAVEENWRRRGIASQLLRTAEHYCWQAGISRVELTTIDSWQPAVMFYQYHGFQIVSD